jgi:membrane protein implicated in regulation of membrane protease activity
MTDISSIGRTMLILGLLVAAAGVLLLVFGRIPFFGRLPGDIAIQRGSWSFYFPLATSIVLSLVLTLVLNLFFRR